VPASAPHWVQNRPVTPAPQRGQVVGFGAVIGEGT
jgi:hypothetical protein